MDLTILHRTHYSFDIAPFYGLQQLRLAPRDCAQQTVRNWDMSITGGVLECSYLDHHGNQVALVSFQGAAHQVTITCEGQVETHDRAGVVGPHRGPAPLWLYLNATDLTRAGAGVRRLIKGLREEEPADIARLHALSARILAAVPYEVGNTHAATTAEESIEEARGVCQDHSHIFIAACRLMGYPARYVSGYLQMTDRVHQDASHAWAEAHIPDLGWIGFDVSNGISPDARYVRVACGVDYRDAAPITGLRYGAGGEALAVDIQVQQQ